jgi:hypothetical protein
VLLSWDPVADARSYNLYRKDEAGLPKLVTSPTKAGYYVDQVDFDNSLKNGESYTYTLEAVVSGYNPVTGAISDPKTVEADIPARTPTIVAAPAVDAVTLAPYASSVTAQQNPDYLEVSWATGKAELPLSYLVEYIYGDGQTLPMVYPTGSISLTGDIYAKRTAFPLVGGNSTVKITARWGKSTSTYTYYAPASVTKAHAGTLTVLPPVGTITLDTTNTVNGSLSLSWDAVLSATGYDVYKAEITSGGSTLSGSIAASQLTGVAIGTYASVGEVTQNGGTVYFTDAGYDSAKKWLYLVIAKNTSARSSAPALYAKTPILPTVTAPTTITVSVFQDTAVGDNALKVSVSWDRVVGETYTLYRAPIELANDQSTVTSVGTFVQIPAASLSDKDGKIIYIDAVGTDQLRLRQSYIYKVVTAKDGNSTEKTATLNAAPFTKFISGSPTVTQGASYGQFKVTPFSPGYDDDLSYEIYAAESDGTRLTSGWVQVTTTNADGDYIWNADDTRKRYTFSQVTKAGNLTLTNTSAYTSVSSPYAPKLPAASSISSGFALHLQGQDANNVVMVPYVGSPAAAVSLTPPATPPANWWLENSIYQATFGVKIYRGEEKGSTIIAKASVATVQFNATNASVTVNGAAVPAWTFYIVLPKYHTITGNTGSETWYVGVEYNDGFNTATGFTNVNYYDISKSGTTVTVSNEN